jgi:hypothetical protein
MIVWIGVMGKSGRVLKRAHAVDWPNTGSSRGLRAVCGKWVYSTQIMRRDPPTQLCRACREGVTRIGKRLY